MRTVFEEMEEIDRSDDGRIRLIRIGPQSNKKIPDTSDVKAWRSLHGYIVKKERCGNCNFWDYDSWRRDTWCNLIAQDCGVERPYAHRDGWCKRWEPNCTIEQWKSKHHYDGYRIMVMAGMVNNHPRPTEEYNCSTCPASSYMNDLKYESLREFLNCAVAERDTGYRKFQTTAKHVCELHPDTEKMKGGE